MKLIWWIKSKIHEWKWGRMTQVERNRRLISAMIMGKELADRAARENYERRLFDK